MIKSILLTTILAITISSVASIPYASAGTPTLDGAIGGAEYANSVLVDKTPDLGGVYDPGTSGSFAGGFINCHDNWRLFWDFDATNIYIAADPLGAGSNCADASISAHLLAITGDPNVGTLTEDCTGTFFSLNAHNFHAAFTCDFTGPPPNLTFLEFVFQTSPPSSTETFVQLPIGATITPIEWSNVRADLDKAGDTTYTGDLQCVWLRVSAFDSRSADNSAGPGARTIWLKLDPSTPPCGESIQVDIDIKPGSDPSSVNCKNLKGTVPVAIFGAENFDATTIDIEIVSMSLVSSSPITVTEVHDKLHIEDLNDDGFDDAVLHLDKAEVCEATTNAPLKETVEVELTGETTDGTQFIGIGDIRIVKR